jgi:hypothetical protein
MTTGRKTSGGMAGHRPCGQSEQPEDRNEIDEGAGMFPRFFLHRV